MTDNDIAKAVAEDPDAAPLDIDWTKASLVIPPGKDIITLRLDRDVLDWLRPKAQATRPASTRSCAPGTKPRSNGAPHPAEQAGRQKTQR